MLYYVSAPCAAGATELLQGVAFGCPLFRGKNVRFSAVWTVKSVRCPEFRSGRFSEVANVLHKRDFQSVTGTLSALGSVSASRSVRSGRFYCIPNTLLDMCMKLHKHSCFDGQKCTHVFKCL